MKTIFSLVFILMLAGCNCSNGTEVQTTVSYPVDNGTPLEIEHFTVDFNDQNDDSRYAMIIRSAAKLEEYNASVTSEWNAVPMTDFSKNIYVRLHNNSVDSVFEEGSSNTPVVSGAYEQGGEVRVVCVTYDERTWPYGSSHNNGGSMVLIKGAAGKPLYFTKGTALRMGSIESVETSLHLSTDALFAKYVPASSDMLYAAVENNRSGVINIETADTKEAFEAIVSKTDTERTAEKVPSEVDWDRSHAFGFATLSEEGVYYYDAVYLGSDAVYSEIRLYSKLSALSRDCADYKAVKTNPRVFGVFDKNMTTQGSIHEVYTMTVSCRPFDTNVTRLDENFTQWLFTVPAFYKEILNFPWE